jgi:hypothetical protein
MAWTSKKNSPVIPLKDRRLQPPVIPPKLTTFSTFFCFVIQFFCNLYKYIEKAKGKKKKGNTHHSIRTYGGRGDRAPPILTSTLD